MIVKGKKCVYQPGEALYVEKERTYDKIYLVMEGSVAILEHSPAKPKNRAQKSRMKQSESENLESEEISLVRPKLSREASTLEERSEETILGTAGHLRQALKELSVALKAHGRVADVAGPGSLVGLREVVDGRQGREGTAVAVDGVCVWVMAKELLTINNTNDEVRRRWRLVTQLLPQLANCHDTTRFVNLLSQMNGQSITVDQRLTIEGRKGAVVYFIVQGTVEIRKNVALPVFNESANLAKENKFMSLCLVQGPCIVGEECLEIDQLYKYTAVTKTNSTLVLQFDNPRKIPGFLSFELYPLLLEHAVLTRYIYLSEGRNGAFWSQICNPRSWLGCRRWLTRAGSIRISDTRLWSRAMLKGSCSTSRNSARRTLGSTAKRSSGCYSMRTSTSLS